MLLSSLKYGVALVHYNKSNLVIIIRRHNRVLLSVTSFYKLFCSNLKPHHKTETVAVFNFQITSTIKSEDREV